MPRSFRTERLDLDLRDACDAEWNHELLGEHEGGTTASVEDVRVRLIEQREAALRNGFGLFTIRRRADRVPLGYCGFIVGRCTFDEPEIVCEILKRFHGRGFATEAGREMVTAAFATGRRRIWSTVGAWNEPSLRVVSKLGFARHHETAGDAGRVVYLFRDASETEFG